MVLTSSNSGKLEHRIARARQQSTARFCASLCTRFRPFSATFGELAIPALARYMPLPQRVEPSNGCVQAGCAAARGRAPCRIASSLSMSSAVKEGDYVASILRSLTRTQWFGLFLGVLLGLGWSQSALAQCGSSANAIVVENCLPGNPSSEWDIGANTAGDLRRSRDSQPISAST